MENKRNCTKSPPREKTKSPKQNSIANKRKLAVGHETIRRQEPAANGASPAKQPRKNAGTTTGENPDAMQEEAPNVETVYQFELQMPDGTRRDCQTRCLTTCREHAARPPPPPRFCRSRSPPKKTPHKLAPCRKRSPPPRIKKRSPQKKRIRSPPKRWRRSPVVAWNAGGSSDEIEDLLSCLSLSEDRIFSTGIRRCQKERVQPTCGRDPSTRQRQQSPPVGQVQQGATFENIVLELCPRGRGLPDGGASPYSRRHPHRGQPRCEMRRTPPDWTYVSDDGESSASFCQLGSDLDELVWQSSDRRTDSSKCSSVYRHPSYPSRNVESVTQLVNRMAEERASQMSIAGLQEQRASRRHRRTGSDERCYAADQCRCRSASDSDVSNRKRRSPEMRGGHRHHSASRRRRDSSVSPLIGRKAAERTTTRQELKAAAAALVRQRLGPDRAPAFCAPASPTLPPRSAGHLPVHSKRAVRAISITLFDTGKDKSRICCPSPADKRPTRKITVTMDTSCPSSDAGSAESGHDELCNFVAKGSDTNLGNSSRASSHWSDPCNCLDAENVDVTGSRSDANGRTGKSHAVEPDEGSDVETYSGSDSRGDFGCVPSEAVAGSVSSDSSGLSCGGGSATYRKSDSSMATDATECPSEIDPPPTAGNATTDSSSTASVASGRVDRGAYCFRSDEQMPDRRIAGGTIGVASAATEMPDTSLTNGSTTCATSVTDRRDSRRDGVVTCEENGKKMPVSGTTSADSDNDFTSGRMEKGETSVASEMETKDSRTEDGTTCLGIDKETPDGSRLDSGTARVTSGEDMSDSQVDSVAVCAKGSEGMSDSKADGGTTRVTSGEDMSDSQVDRVESDTGMSDSKADGGTTRVTSGKASQMDSAATCVASGKEMTDSLMESSSSSMPDDGSVSEQSDKKRGGPPNYNGGDMVCLPAVYGRPDEKFRVLVRRLSRPLSVTALSLGQVPYPGLSKLEPVDSSTSENSSEGTTAPSVILLQSRRNCVPVQSSVLARHSLWYRRLEHPPTAAGSLQVDPTLSPAALERAVSWMYTGRIMLDETNVRIVLQVARSLQMPELIEICLDRIGDRPSVNDVLTRTLRQEPADWPEDVVHQLAYNFPAVVSSRQFPRLSLNNVCQLLASDFLRANSERDVYDAALCWLSYDWPERRGRVERVFRSVRLPYLNAQAIDANMDLDTTDVDEEEATDIVRRQRERGRRGGINCSQLQLDHLVHTIEHVRNNSDLQQKLSRALVWQAFEATGVSSDYRYNLQPRRMFLRSPSQTSDMAATPETPSSTATTTTTTSGSAETEAQTTASRSSNYRSSFTRLSRSTTTTTTLYDTRPGYRPERSLSDLDDARRKGAPEKLARSVSVGGRSYSGSEVTDKRGQSEERKKYKCGSPSARREEMASDNSTTASERRRQDSYDQTIKSSFSSPTCLTPLSELECDSRCAQASCTLASLPTTDTDSSSSSTEETITHTSYDTAKEKKQKVAMMVVSAANKKSTVDHSDSGSPRRCPRRRNDDDKDTAPAATCIRNKVAAGERQSEDDRSSRVSANTISPTLSNRAQMSGPSSTDLSSALPSLNAASSSSGRREVPSRSLSRKSLSDATATETTEWRGRSRGAAQRGCHLRTVSPPSPCKKSGETTSESNCRPRIESSTRHRRRLFSDATHSAKERHREKDKKVSDVADRLSRRERNRRRESSDVTEETPTGSDERRRPDDDNEAAIAVGESHRASWRNERGAPPCAQKKISRRDSDESAPRTCSCGVAISDREDVRPSDGRSVVPGSSGKSSEGDDDDGPEKCGCRLASSSSSSPPSPRRRLNKVELLKNESKNKSNTESDSMTTYAKLTSEELALMSDHFWKHRHSDKTVIATTDDDQDDDHHESNASAKRSTEFDQICRLGAQVRKLKLEAETRVRANCASSSRRRTTAKFGVGKDDATPTRTRADGTEVPRRPRPTPPYSGWQSVARAASTRHGLRSDHSRSDSTYTATSVSSSSTDPGTSGRSATVEPGQRRHRRRCCPTPVGSGSSSHRNSATTSPRSDICGRQRVGGVVTSSADVSSLPADSPIRRISSHIHIRLKRERSPRTPPTTLSSVRDINVRSAPAEAVRWARDSVQVCPRERGISLPMEIPLDQRRRPFQMADARKGSGPPSRASGAMGGGTASPSRSVSATVRIVSSVAGCVLFFGGISVRNPADYDRIASLVHSYNVRSGEWSEAGKMPEPLSDAAACLLGDKIYLSGGNRHVTSCEHAETSAHLWRLSVTGGTWQAMPDMPGPRAGHAMVALDGKMFAIGGARNVSGRLTCRVDEFVPDKASWQPGSRLPYPLWRCGATSRHRHIFCCGGLTRRAGGDEDDYVSDVLVYSARRKCWLTLTNSLARPRAFAAVTSFQGRMLLVGGLTVSQHSCKQRALTEVDVFDDCTRIWQPLRAMSGPRFGACIAATGDKLFIFGGRDGRFSSPLNTVEVLTLGHNIAGYGHDMAPTRYAGDDVQILPTPISNTCSVALRLPPSKSGSSS